MHVVTLLYHDIVPPGRWELSGFQGPDADIYKMDRDAFRNHLMAIRRSLCGGCPITADELRDQKSGSRPFLLTFDDGGVGAFLYTADLLSEFGWKANFFITAGRIGTSGFLSRSQIRELRRQGHVIGGHSFTHPTRMARCSPKELDEEWQKCVMLLQEIVGERILVASVPGGYYSQQVALAATRAGIEVLFNSEPVTSVSRVSNCLVLGRFTALRATAPKWSASIVAGQWRPQIAAYLYWNAKKIGKTLGGSIWLRARARVFAHRMRNPHL